MTLIFPIGSKMVQFFGLTDDRSSTGVWVGIMAFSMMGPRVISSPIWGIICDNYGRRPAFICSMIAVSLFSLSFGLSTEYWMALVSRALLGGFCCLTLVSKTIIGELTNSDPGSMVWVAMSSQLGSISGNLVGGFLEDPNSSGIINWPIFDEFPFLLPNLFICCLSVLGLISSIIFVPETLIKRHKDEYRGRNYKELIKDKSVFWDSCLYFLWSFNSSGFIELFALWCWTDKENGGFEMQPKEIGGILFASTAVLIVLEVPI